MTREVTEVALCNATPGTRHSIPIVRFGEPDARPKVYIQAALHADEAPSLLVAHHLLRLLDAAESRDELRGQVVVVPFANPLGLAQSVNGDHLGRFDLSTGRNFNRNWPNISSELAGRVEGRLGEVARDNEILIRQTITEILDERSGGQEIDTLCLALAREAFTSDLVLDLHCDDEGLMHMFVQPEQAASVEDLANELGCRAVFMQKPSGGGTFTEVCADPWLKLAAARSGGSIPEGCVAATIELRGFADIGDDIAAADAKAIMNALRRRGYLAGPLADAPEPLCTATSFEACDIVRTPVFGVIVYRAELGETVASGQPIADIVAPGPAASAARTTIRARADGIVVTRRLKKMVMPNQVIAKVAGRARLSHRTGYLLED